MNGCVMEDVETPAAYVRLTVSSPPLVKTVLPSTEKTIEPVSTPLACAPSTVILGLTKFELACHM